MHGGSNDINAALEIPCARQSDTKGLSKDVREEYKLFTHLHNGWLFSQDRFEYFLLSLLLIAGSGESNQA